MANGKGTISCHYCRHYAPRPVEWCKLFNAPLPTSAIATDNPLCADFAESGDSSVQFGMPGQLAELLPKMRRGYLYAFSVSVSPPAGGPPGGCPADTLSVGQLWHTTVDVKDGHFANRDRSNTLLHGEAKTR